MNDRWPDKGWHANLNRTWTSTPREVQSIDSSIAELRDGHSSWSCSSSMHMYGMGGGTVFYDADLRSRGLPRQAHMRPDMLKGVLSLDHPGSRHRI